MSQYIIAECTGVNRAEGTAQLKAVVWYFRASWEQHSLPNVIDGRSTRGGTLYKPAMHGSKFVRYSRDRQNFNPWMGRLIVHLLINLCTTSLVSLS